MFKEIISDFKKKNWIQKIQNLDYNGFWKKNRKTILIIDDDVSIRLLLEHFLKSHYKVVAKANGFEGMQYLGEGKIPDLIITDVAMPKLNGLEFLKSLKESGYYRDIPLIVLSGTESSVDIIKCIQIGADDYLLKPFNPENLLLKIENLLGKINVNANV